MEEDTKRLNSIIKDCSCSFLLSKKEGAFLMTSSLSDDVNVLYIDDILQDFAANVETELPAPEDVAFLQYTSGSTGDPKGVILTHNNLMHNLVQLYKCWYFNAGSVQISWLPHFHDMGLTGTYLLTVACGAKGYFMSPLTFIQNPTIWLNALTKFGGTHGVAPNFAYELILRKRIPDDINLSKVVSLVNAAEPIHIQTLDKFLAALSPYGLMEGALTPAYGQAEHVVCISMHQIGQKYTSHKGLVACGLPADGVVVRVVDPVSTQEVPDGEEGEIWVTSEAKGVGYWEKAKLTSQTFQAHTLSEDDRVGYLRTGDLGFTKDGQIYISGRLKDMVIIRGHNIHPNDVEYLLERSYPTLRAGCTVAFPVDLEEADNLGEIIGIVAEVKDPNLDKEELTQLAIHMSATVALQIEAEVGLITLAPPRSVPKTTSGKVRRKKCKEDLLDGKILSLFTWKRRKVNTSRAEIPIPTSERPTPTMIAGVISQVLQESVSEDTNFWSLGCSSLKAAEISQALENELGMQISVHQLYKYKTPEEVSQLATELLPPPPSYPTEGTERGRWLGVIGMACRFPGANNIDDYWKILISGTDTSITVPLSDNQGGLVRGCFTSAMTTFDYQWFGVSKAKASEMDPQHCILLHTVYDALLNAGFDPSLPLDSKTGVFVGISSHDNSYLAEMGPLHTETAPHAMAANLISHHFGLTGPSVAVDVTCASSLYAVNLASNAIINGECKMAVVAAVNALLIPELFKVNSLATDKACQPFDKASSGYVRSEGCGVIILKKAGKPDINERVLALLCSSVAGHCGNRSVMLTMPSGKAEVEMFHEAFEKAGLKHKNDVSFIECHAAGNTVSDITETESVITAYHDKTNRPMYASSVKGNIGHMESAAGMTSLIKTILALDYGILPPTVNLERQHKLIPKQLQIPKEPVKLKNDGGQVLVAGVTTLSLGGAQAHAILSATDHVPCLERVSPGVILTMDNAKDADSSDYIEAFKELRTLPNFQAGEELVGTKLKDILTSKIPGDMTVLNFFMLEFTFIYSIHRLLRSAMGKSRPAFYSATNGPSELLAAHFAGMLGMEDTLTIMLSHIVPDSVSINRAITARPPKVPFYSHSSGKLYLPGDVPLDYLPNFMRMLQEQPTFTSGMDDIMNGILQLHVHTFASIGNGFTLDKSNGVHPFTKHSLSTVHNVRKAFMELRSDYDTQVYLRQRHPLDSAKHPSILERCPFRAKVEAILSGHTATSPRSPDNIPSQRRRSSSVYSDLVVRVASSVSAESNNSITVATLEMTSEERLLFLSELVCLTTQEVLDLDIMNKSISEHQDLAELGMTEAQKEDFIKMIKLRTGITMTVAQLEDVTPHMIAQNLLKQLYPGISDRKIMTQLTTSKDDILKVLFEKIKMSQPELSPLEDVATMNFFALGISSLTLTEVLMMLDEKYAIQMKFSKLVELGTIEKLAEFLAEEVKQGINPYHPRLTNMDYATLPSMDEIVTLGEDSLKQVRNFTVIHKTVGSVQFLGYTDVTAIDLDATVIIEPGEVTVYPAGIPVPKSGEGLNKPSLVTFYGLQPRKKNKEGYEKMERRLRKNCTDKDLLFISYDRHSGDFLFKVNGFD